MATRFHEPVRRRVPVPWTDTDDARLAAIREDPAIRSVLGALSGAPLDAPGASPRRTPCSARFAARIGVELYPDEVRRDLGALSGAAMARVGEGLKAALAVLG